MNFLTDVESGKIVPSGVMHSHHVYTNQLDGEPGILDTENALEEEERRRGSVFDLLSRKNLNDSSGSSGNQGYGHRIMPLNYSFTLLEGIERPGENCLDRAGVISSDS